MSAHLDQYFVRSKTALTLSASYQRGYEAAEEQRICPPGVTDPSADCIDGRAAAPARDENLLLSAGLRHQFMRDGRLLNLAVAPLVTYDAIDDVFGVDVPIYMMPDADSGLTGGVRFGYRSDRENEFSVGLFVGVAFNILR